MEEPTWPEWGALQPPWKHYEKEYFIGEDGSMHAGEVLHDMGIVKVLRCHPCIMIHLWPLSSPEYLSAYYERKFYQETKPAYLTEYQEDADWWLATHGTVLDAANPTCHTENAVRVRMLDIGSGPGYPLDVGKDRGYFTNAIEPSPVAAKYLRSKGHRVFEMSLEQYHAYSMGHFPSYKYDLLYAWEVLEHQPNPEDFLLKCYDLLAPGGSIVVAVPNDYSPAQTEACKKYGIGPWFLSAPDHQQYLTPKTLQLMARRCGFRQKYMRMTFPMIEHFMIDEGKNYVGNPTLGRECHRWRMQYELDIIKNGKWKELEADYIANVRARVGREIIAIFQKDK